MARKTRQSRRKTPWDGSDMTPTQKFIHDQHKIHYEQRHPSILESGEVPLINSYVPSCCPHCQSTSFMKFGLDSNCIQRYRCDICNQRFKPTTGTILSLSKDFSVRQERCREVVAELRRTASDAA